MKNWIYLASLSALLFGIGDFLVVTQERNVSVIALFAGYSAVIGILGSLLLSFIPDVDLKKLYNIDPKIFILISVLHFIAYLAHFGAIQQAKNPGYANSLVMFHVIVLALLSYWLLNKELTIEGIFGMLLMFAGAFIIVR